MVFSQYEEKVQRRGLHMGMSVEESKLLRLLETGELDGDVGETRTFRIYSSVRCGRYIKNGIPTVFREGRIRSRLIGKEDDSSPVTREEEECLSEESKLLFLQKYGWLINNEFVRSYSKKFKPNEAERKKT